MAHDEEADVFWRRFVWNRYALGFLVVLAAVGLVLLLREVPLGGNLKAVEGFYQQADAESP